MEERREDFEHKVTSLLDGSKQDDCVTNGLSALTEDSRHFISKANKRMKRMHRTSALLRMGRLPWQASSQTSMEAQFNTLMPKLKGAEDDLHLWLDVLFERKKSANEHCRSLLEEVNEDIKSAEAKLDHFDNLTNDCRQVNYNINRELSEIDSMIRFEMVNVLKAPPLVALPHYLPFISSFSF